MESRSGPGSSPRSSQVSDRLVERDHGSPLGVDPAGQPTGIRAMCLVDMGGRPIVRLVVQGVEDRILMDSNQDLEDTLALGAFIVEATADVLEDVSKLMKDEAWRAGVGSEFESYLERTEAATRRIRSRLSGVPSS